MGDYISRDKALDFHIQTYDLNISAQDERVLGDRFEKFLESIPAADVVARDCYDRILAENDTMREQLAQIGKKPGDEMNDVRPAARGHWTRVDYEPCGHDYICSECDCKSDGDWNFCHDCGAYMREVKPDEL